MEINLVLLKVFEKNVKRPETVETEAVEEYTTFRGLSLASAMVCPAR
jgi:hypothetical protein